MAGLFGMEIALLTCLYLFLIVKCNPEYQLSLDGRTWVFIGICSIIGGLGIACFLDRWGLGGQFSCGALAAYLLTASITDLQTCEVYDFLPALTAIIGIGLFWLSPKEESMLSLLLYLGIQILLFMRMYGKADGYAFLVCALFESRFGHGLLTYLLHMGAAFLLLGIVQAVKGNINKNGNLRKPVPFVPYIAVTVWWFL